MIGKIEHQTDKSRYCQVGALMLCFLHILTVSGMAYQGRILRYLASGDSSDLLLVYGLWLSPALVVLIFKRVCPLVYAYAGPILIDFSARTYFVWDYYWTGVNSGGQKGDWAHWLTTFMGMASLFVLACWLVLAIGVVLTRLINRLRQL